MKKEPLRFEVEYSIANPEYKGKPMYTAKVTLEAPGCPDNGRFEKELGMNFWEWPAMQDHVAKLIGKVCEQIARGQLPGEPVVHKGESARILHGVVLAAASTRPVAHAAG
jgi:hypothetical protein